MKQVHQSKNEHILIKLTDGMQFIFTGETLEIYEPEDNPDKGDLPINEYFLEDMYFNAEE